MAETLPSKPRHPGVPNDWQLLGEGGNAYVWGDGPRAIKRLKPNASPEARARFRREAEVMRLLQDDPALRVVPLQELRERAAAFEIVMPKMTGSLESVIERFKGNPEKSARALGPIADTLAMLARRENPIYHRDIKPTNLLFKNNEDTLYLADFGCAYLGEDVRLTPQGRAMGAYAYRPPEYSAGRLEAVTEKGDVFSLGKVLWAMVNGEPKFVFPESHWYLPEYNLPSRFTPSPAMHHAMLVVAKATAVLPGERPTLQQLTDMLLAITSPTVSYGPEDVAGLLHAQALMEVRHNQRRASVAAFIRATHSDLLDAITNLHAKSPALQIWQEWQAEATRTPQTVDALVQQTADQGSDAPAVVSRYRGLAFHARFLPETGSNPARLWVQLASEQRQDVISSFWVSNSPGGLVCEFRVFGDEQKRCQYTLDRLHAFLSDATKAAMSSLTSA